MTVSDSRARELPEDTVRQVQQLVYRATVEQGRPPVAARVATALSLPKEDVLAAFRRLREVKLLALAPATGEIVMAPPFAAAPTPFWVTVGERSYFANCVWDAFGVAAALHHDAVIDTSCACCGEPMELEIAHGQPVEIEAVAHFAVPAAQWWDDITYT